MPLLSVLDAQLAFGHTALLDKVSFSLEPKERVGLIGRNGAGKSSFLKAIAGLHPLDDGRIIYQDNLNIAYVAQEPQFKPNQTIFDAVADGLGEIKHALQRYHQAGHRLSQDPTDETALNDMMEAQHVIEESQGWEFDKNISMTLEQLGFSPDTLVDQLSGGWKKRVALARAIVSNPDLLILDEPTNHLDIKAIEWLENLLITSPFSLLLITHDHQFLDHVCNRIIELDRGTLTSYQGDFQYFQAQKAIMLAVEAEQERLFDKKQAEEEAWIRRGVKARLKRNMGRVARLESMRSERSERKTRMGQVQFQLTSGDLSGKLVADLDQVSLSYADKTIIDRFSTRIMRGDKIALIGENGAGKTTLLKLILNELQPDSGDTTYGTKQSIAYFDQFRTALDEEMRLVDVISPGGDFIMINNQERHVISYLEDFLFPAARARSPVKSLSGGERNRLLLARLFSKPSNVLVLDEPTNDLDIDTLELLENLLIEYDGTVFLVSHDRHFIDNVATQIIVAKGHGQWAEYLGSYSDNMAFINEKNTPSNPVANLKPIEKQTNASSHESKKKRKKLSFNEQKQLDQLPSEIEALEHDIASMNALLLTEAVYQDAKALMAHTATLDQLTQTLDFKMDLWSQLESKRID